MRQIVFEQELSYKHQAKSGTDQFSSRQNVKSKNTLHIYPVLCDVFIYYPSVKRWEKWGVKQPSRRQSNLE